MKGALPLGVPLTEGLLVEEPQGERAGVPLSQPLALGLRAGEPDALA